MHSRRTDLAMARLSALVLALCCSAEALVLGGAGSSPTTRRQALQAAGAALLIPSLAPNAALAEDEAIPAEAAPPPPPPPVVPAGPGSTKSGVGIKVINKGTGGGKPVRGDLIAIRFKGSVTSNGNVFDDIMESPEPYYFRVGSEKVLPGVEDAVQMMTTGDKWELSVPGKLGFGEKGRSASPGKPRIPSNAVSFPQPLPLQPCWPTPELRPPLSSGPDVHRRARRRAGQGRRDPGGHRRIGLSSRLAASSMHVQCIVTS